MIIPPLYLSHHTAFRTHYTPLHRFSTSPFGIPNALFSLLSDSSGSLFSLMLGAGVLASPAISAVYGIFKLMEGFGNKVAETGGFDNKPRNSIQ